MSNYKLDLVDKSLRAFYFPLIENQRKIIGTAWVQVANAISSFGIIYQKKGVAHVPIPPIGYYLNLIKSKKQPPGNIKLCPLRDKSRITLKSNKGTIVSWPREFYQ